MKKLIGTSLMLLSLTALAGNNKYEMTKEGFYSGRLDDGRACSVKVTNVKKSLFTRTVKSMDVQFVSPILVKNFSLVCENNFENGHWCTDVIKNDSFLVDTKAGYQADRTPKILFYVKQKAEWCRDLVIN